MKSGDLLSARYERFDPAPLAEPHFTDKGLEVVPRKRRSLVRDLFSNPGRLSPHHNNASSNEGRLQTARSKTIAL